MKIGIDLGGSHIGVGLVDAQNKIVEKTERRLMNAQKKKIKENIEKYIIDGVQKFGQSNEINSVGISVPGTVIGGKILKSVNLGIQNYDLKDILEAELKLPVKIRNDAKCAALAESKIGCLKSIKRAIFLTLGTGIGGAVLIDGKLLNTGEFPGTEFGHMIIEKDGRKCKCGNRGCFETYASMKILKDRLRAEWGLTEKTRGEELLAMLRSGKKETATDEFIEYLAIGFANLINIFEPQAIGIGGSFVYFQDVLLKRLANEIVSKKLLFNEHRNLKLVPAVLGNDAGIIGSTL